MNAELRPMTEAERSAAEALLVHVRAHTTSLPTAAFAVVALTLAWSALAGAFSGAFADAVFAIGSEGIFRVTVTFVVLGLALGALGLRRIYLAATKLPRAIASDVEGRLVEVLTVESRHAWATNELGELGYLHDLGDGTFLATRGRYVPAEGFPCARFRFVRLPQAHLGLSLEPLGGEVPVTPAPLGTPVIEDGSIVPLTLRA